MCKLEKTIWAVGTALLAASTFLTQSQEQLAFLKIPAVVFDGALVLGGFIRFMYLRLKGKPIEEPKKDEGKADDSQ